MMDKNIIPFTKYFLYLKNNKRLINWTEIHYITLQITPSLMFAKLQFPVRLVTFSLSLVCIKVTSFFISFSSQSAQKGYALFAWITMRHLLFSPSQLDQRAHAIGVENGQQSHEVGYKFKIQIEIFHTEKVSSWSKKMIYLTFC